jgi:hypothetical protein
MYLINKTVDFSNGKAKFVSDEKYDLLQIYLCLEIPPVKNDLETVCNALPLYLIKKCTISNELQTILINFNEKTVASYLIKMELESKSYQRMIGMVQTVEEWKNIHKNPSNHFIPLMIDNDPPIFLEKDSVLESNLELKDLKEWFNVENIECSLIFTLKHE